MKIGAILILENGQGIWMEEMYTWPSGYFEGEEEAKTVKVTGILIEKYDLPVFINNDSIIQQGIPMPKGTDLKKASYRYLLKKYKYIEIK